MFKNQKFEKIDGKFRIIIDGTLKFLDEIDKNDSPHDFAGRLYNAYAEGDKSLLHPRDLSYLESNIYTLEALRWRIEYEGFRYTLLGYYDARAFSHFPELKTAWDRYRKTNGRDRQASLTIQRILRADKKASKTKAATEVA